MIRNCLRKLGTIKAILLVTAFVILASLLLYVIIAAALGDIKLQGIIFSIMIPAIVAPVLTYYFLRLAIRLDRSEAEITHSEEKYRAILDNIEDGYFEVDIKGNFTFFNDSMCRMLGYSSSEMMGKNNRDYMDAVNAKKVYQAFNRVYQTGQSAKGFDWETIKKNGVKRHFDASISLITDEAGNRIGFRGIARDITERKQAENSLRESEEKYRHLVNHAPAGIYEIDFKKGKFVNVNDVMCTYTGYTRGEMLSMNPLELLTEESQNRFLARMDKTLNGQAVPTAVEYNIRPKDGGDLWVILNVSYIHENGKPKGATVVVHDITERKKAEEERKELEAQLRQAQKMEAIGTLAGGIAHDFNNLLSVIIGYTELLMMNGAGGAEARQNLNEIFKASKHARDMVKQILAFSRQGKQERKPIQVGHIAKEALKLLRASLPATIVIKEHIEKDTGIVEADPTQIHQVPMNLCTNAAHAINENDGILEISLNNIELSRQDAEMDLELKPGPYLKLSVSDSGHGIRPEALDKIFDPYYTTKEKGEGTGLGLAVVQGIVKSHNGAVTVESTIGTGSTFHVYLPTINRETTTEENDAKPLPMGNERILFIDDEQPLAEIGKQMLKRLGYTVSTRTSSIEALELFKAQPHRFDLVITDIVMPNMTGDILAEKLMEVRSDIPVILCTGYSRQFTKTQTKEMGIQSLLMKPFVMQDLAHAVRQALTVN
jgi:PAS domain S-box-containing protein